MQSIRWVLLCAVCSVTGNLFLKHAVSSLKLDKGLFSLSALIRLAHVPELYIGLTLYVFGALLWLQVLSADPLGQAYPVLISLTFILLTLVAIVWLHEPITWIRTGGLAFILLGIFMVARG